MRFERRFLDDVFFVVDGDVMIGEAHGHVGVWLDVDVDDVGLVEADWAVSCQMILRRKNVVDRLLLIEIQNHFWHKLIKVLLWFGVYQGASTLLTILPYSYIAIFFNFWKLEFSN